MTVFEYEAADEEHEDNIECGTVIARTKAEATTKLKSRLGHMQFSLKRLGFIAGLFRVFTADIR